MQLVVPALALLLAACQAGGPMSRSAGVSAGSATLAATFYTPSRGPMALGSADNLAAPPEPLKAIVYVPECASPHAPPDHIEYFQSLGHAAVIPSFGGDQCVLPTDRLGTVHAEIDDVVDVLRQLPWVRDDAIYLVGHGVGADVASTYTKAGTFRGIIGIAAACPFGIQNNTPMLTLRALEDRVLANRGTRCSQYATENALHVEFSGSDHTLWLTKLSTEPGTRQLLRNSIASFIEASDVPTTNLAERTPEPDPFADPALVPEAVGEVSPDATPEAPADETVSPPDAEAPNAGPDADDAGAPTEAVVPAEATGDVPADASAEAATAADAAVPAETEADAPAEAPAPTGDADVLYLPTLQLPPGRN